MVRINHCRDCNKDFVECETCLKTFKTNILSAVEIVNHDCTQEDAGGETTKRTAAAAGVAGGAAAGTAAGVGVTAGAPAALGAVGFTSSGVAGGSIAASLQSLLYAGATPAGGWFATCTSAAMGGAAGTAAVTAVAATGGIAVAAGAGYGLYRFLKKKKMTSCPWCKDNKQSYKVNGNHHDRKGESGQTPEEKNQDNAEPKENKVPNAVESHQTEGINDNLFEEFGCPICTVLMGPPTHIWQCEEGHIICEKCKNNPEVRSCPSCRGKFSGRNVALERMAARILK